MRQLYSFLTYLLRPIALAVVLWRGLRDRRYWAGLGERCGFGARVGSAQTLWVHAVSLGEVTAAALLVRALRAGYPEWPLLLTTATLTGRARAQALFGDSITVRFLPYDTPGSMRRFLARARPRLAIIMETELWPNLYHRCRQLGIPIVVANARLSTKSVVHYLRFGALFREALSGNVWIAARSAEDAERFLALGAAPSRTHVVGNLKFDVAAAAASAASATTVVAATASARGLALRAAYWDARPVWIAGSTHDGEEEMVLTAHTQLQSAVPGALLLLVPRHPERFQSVADLLNRRGFRFERRSSDNVVRADAQVVLVDTVGELAALYGAVDAAFVGGSLVPVGGHNLLEPAALGVPVITGPYQSSARDVAELLLGAGAALKVADAAELGSQLQVLFTDPLRRRQMGANALRVVAGNRGSVARLLELIAPLLAARPGVDP